MPLLGCGKKAIPFFGATHIYEREMSVKGLHLCTHQPLTSVHLQSYWYMKAFNWQLRIAFSL